MNLMETLNLTEVLVDSTFLPVEEQDERGNDVVCDGQHG